MVDLLKWIDTLPGFVREVTRLTTESGADGRVSARDLETAIAVVDPAGVLWVSQAGRARADADEGAQHGLDDVAGGRTRPAKGVLDEILHKHRIPLEMKRKSLKAAGQGEAERLSLPR